MTRPGEERRGTLYGAASRLPLGPRQIRSKRFGSTRLGRRGMDPGEVRDFLDRVAADMAALYAELARVRDENLRIKCALRDWQTRWGRQRQRWIDG
ncbi:DivIVA domain-containing protein [Micromonospora pattaloongensis]|uniref:DivIVA domain-containing protein n=1 Tax=Micromonospora pattaloongensis TaxID=405436 RepID=UPI001FDF34CC|nr:DivIVA domain-containing protein [Micromonospora pattaloongensis]